MKRLFLSFVLLAITTSRPADNAAQRATLHSFNILAQRCVSSARNTSNKEAFNAFNTVIKTYRNNRTQLTHLDKLDDITINKLYQRCSEIMDQNLLVRRSIRTIPQTTPGISVDPLLDSISEFIELHQDELLKKTTTQRWLTRLALQTFIETGAAVSEHWMKKKAPGKSKQKTKKKNMPKLGKRFSSITNISKRQAQLLAGSIGIAGARIGSHLLVDEFVPRGVSTYMQRLTELVAPVIMAGLIMSVSTGKMKPLASAVLQRAFFRFMMTRALLDKRSKMYKTVNIAAYLTPFLLGGSFGVACKEGFDANAIGNIAIDGIASALIYDLLPRSVDKALPNKIALNPAHRRKACKNIPRDAVAKLYQSVTDIARTTA